MKMVRKYEDLTEDEQSRLSVAWAKIHDALSDYQATTGAENLSNIIYEELWEQINYQADNW